MGSELTRRQFLSLAGMGAAGVLLAACGPSPTEPPAAAEVPTEKPVPTAAPVAEEPITVEFWHARGGHHGEVLDELVKRFNESQDKIVVNATYQGGYDDCYNAFLASIETGTEPNIIQHYELAVQTMFDSGRLIPAYELMTGNEQDAFLDIGRYYYGDEVGMVGVPFNISIGVVFYNADMFEDAGVEPPSEDWTLDDLKATLDAVKAADVAQYPITFVQHGGIYEWLLAASGIPYFDNDNGHSARATQVLWNEDEKAVQVFEFLTSLVKDGYAPNLAANWNDCRDVFFAKQSAVLFECSSAAFVVQEGSDFNVGSTFFPHHSPGFNGVAVGGGALWLIRDEDEPEKDATSWEFIRWMVAPDQQAYWHMNTGYNPVIKAADDSPTLKAFWEENPNFSTAHRQLLATVTVKDGKPNYATIGGRAGPFVAIRTIMQEAYSRVVEGGLTPQDALDKAAEKANEELANYNAFFE